MRMLAKLQIVSDLRNSARIDFVENIAENEPIAQSKTEFLFCGFLRECVGRALVHLP